MNSTHRDAAPHPLAPGTVPPSLARQPQLGTLRLEGNKLGGGLAPFADALPPASRLYHFDVSRNQLTGGLPKGMQQMGVFEPGEDFVMASPDGKVRNWVL